MSDEVTEEQLNIMLEQARENGNMQEVRRIKLIRRMNCPEYQARYFKPLVFNR